MLKSHSWLRVLWLKYEVKTFSKTASRRQQLAKVWMSKPQREGAGPPCGAEGRNCVQDSTEWEKQSLPDWEIQTFSRGFFFLIIYWGETSALRESGEWLMEISCNIFYKGDGKFLLKNRMIWRQIFACKSCHEQSKYCKNETYYGRGGFCRFFKIRKIILMLPYDHWVCLW